MIISRSKFLLYRTEASSGVAIPYPLISLHAVQRLKLPASSEEVKGLYMQIANPIPSDNGGAEEDEEEDSINLTIVPPPTAAPAVEETAAAAEGAETKPEETATQALFAAVSACSNLHPDPVTNGDEEEGEDYDGNEQPGVGGLLRAGLIMSGAADGGLPAPVDGSSGWITADNMHEYFDEEGNWIGEGEPPSLPGLGPGAGNIHDRDDGTAQNGEGNDDDETKWRRTD
jgi:nucleotide-sensitive chloride channel 1A